MALTLTSPAFKPFGPIPPEFTRTNANISPPLEWHDAPAATRSFALILEDPDAPRGTFRHWAVYDIPAASTSLPTGAGSLEPVTRLRMGRNDFGNSRYDGPQPPAGDHAHRYHFRLFALNVTELNLPPQSSAAQILAAATAQCLGEAEIVGVFASPAASSHNPPPQHGATHPGIADADKLARTGSVDEPIRNTPPAGAWNDVARNE